MIRITRLGLLAVTVVAGLIAGCDQSSPAPAKTTSKDLSLAVIPKGTTHEFWKSIHAGAIKASQEFSTPESKITIIWKGPLKEDDRDQQISVVDDFVSKGVSGIVVAPLDDVALKTPIVSATRSGIPVVIIDSDLKAKAGEDYVSFVATDNYQGGKLAGEYMATLLGPRGGKVVVLRYQQGSASTNNREQGFLDAIKAHSEIVVVSANQYGGATADSAFSASENLLGPLKNAEGALAVDGIFCPNESTTFGMLRALEGAQLAGKVKFVGFDASQELVKALAAGKINALTVQNPFNMGYQGVKTLVMHLRDTTVPGRVDTGVTVVTRDNMNQPEINDLLHPPLEQYLK